VRGIFSVVDAVYRRTRQLRPVGSVLFVGVSRPASTQRHRNGKVPETIAHLHFDNARAAAVQANGRLQNGMRFGRLLRDSFAELAKHARDDAAYRDVAAFEGVTWFGSHGEAVGFQSEPLAEGWRRRWLSAHFRMLVWAFSPTGDTRALDEIAPRHFRITREALIASFADNRKRAR
jgi:YkoP-like protein